MKNLARGHEVEKHNSEGKNVRRTLHRKRAEMVLKKYSEKVTSPNKPKEKRKEKETHVAIGLYIVYYTEGLY